MHTSPPALQTGLTIIREAEGHELEIIRDQLLTSIRQDLRSHVKRPPTGNPLLDEVRQWVDTYTIEEKTKDRLTMLRLANNRLTYKKNTAQPVTPQMIDTAKEYPIEEIYEGELRRYGNKLWGRCPFHNNGQEKTPSFTINEKNSFKCFGCGCSGDSIAFFMKNNNVSFIQAVKTLCQ